MRDDGRPRILLAVTTEMTAKHFVLGLARQLVADGATVIVVADGVESLQNTAHPHGMSFRAVPMDRDPSPLRDLRSLRLWWRLLGSERPDIIAYATPKASLLAALAARGRRVPSRIYQLWGLRLETVVGYRKVLLWLAERITAWSSTRIVANSASLAREYSALRLNGAKDVHVLGPGSSHGVDLHHFRHQAIMTEIDSRSAEFLKGSGRLVVGFVGRLHPDKGLDTLLEAAHILRRRGTRIGLLLVGNDEGFRLGDEFSDSESDIHFAGRVDDTRPYYAVMDVLVLMSRREGFPNVVLEASAMGVPCVVSNATGVVDSVVDGTTGIIVPVDDATGLASVLEQLASDRSRIRDLGQGAQAWVQDSYSSAEVLNRYSRYIRERSGSDAEGR